MTLIEFVAGKRRPRGNEFKGALQILAAMIGRDYGADNYKPLSRKKRDQLKQKIKARIPQGYYDPKPELTEPLTRYQCAVNRKVAKYLESRGIPFELARQFGVGYAKYNDWEHFNEKKEPVRQWVQGRVVFPVYNDKGELMNLYGRALEDGTRDCPKGWKHDFLPGTKGIGNQKDLKKSNIHIVEGMFDLLSIKAARPTANVSAVFGVHGFDWDLVDAKYICFCFDADVAGGKWKEIADEGLKREKKVYWLDTASYAGCGDLNETLKARGKIDFKYNQYKGE
jgi:DNA primase